MIMGRKGTNTMIEMNRKSRVKKMFSQTGIDDVLAVQSFRLKKTKTEPSDS